MTLEERRDYIYNTMKMALENNDDLLIDVVDSMDSYDGFMNDSHVYNMSELDEVLYGMSPSDIIHLLAPNFKDYSGYFYFNGNGWLESCDDKAEFYREYNSTEEILDNYVKEYYHYDLSREYDNFETLAEEYNDYSDEDVENETDEEFTERIDDLYAEL